MLISRGLKEMLLSSFIGRKKQKIRNYFTANDNETNVAINFQLATFLIYDSISN